MLPRKFLDNRASGGFQAKVKLFENTYTFASMSAHSKSLIGQPEAVNIQTTVLMVYMYMTVDLIA